MKIDSEAIQLALAEEVKRNGGLNQPRFLREINARVHPPARVDRILLPFLSEPPLPTIEGAPFVTRKYVRGNFT